MAKSERSRLRKKCIDLAKKCAKGRDQYRCQRNPEHKGQMHGSHVIAVSRDGRLAASPNNIKCLCAHCHFWWHENPIEAARWFEEYAPERLAELEAELIENNKKGTIPIGWWRDQKKKLTSELKEIERNAEK